MIFTKSRQYDFITKTYSWLNGGIGDTEEILNCYFARNTSALPGEFQSTVWLYGVNVIYSSDSFGSNRNISTLNHNYY